MVDDGIATGATTRAALQAIRERKPERLVLAVPVAPSECLPELRREADDVVCLEDYESFGAIGYYYSDFRQVPDDEVIALLAKHPVMLQPLEFVPVSVSAYPRKLASRAQSESASP